MLAMESNPRKLASVQVVREIKKHIGADFLELALVLGWQVIIRAGEVAVGDKIIFCEIDSLLPVDAPWLPVAIKDRISKKQTKDMYLVKTIKLRGELSQGLIVPLPDNLKQYDVGADISSILGIKKYEPIIFTGKFSNCSIDKGVDYPIHLIPKTDEIRIQSKPVLLNQIQGKPYYITVKLDGTSATYLLQQDNLTVCSRNFTLFGFQSKSPQTCPWWYIAEKYNLAQKLHNFPHLAIQGEICGPNIQRNLLNLKDLTLFVFQLIDIRTKERLPFPEFISLCENVLQLPTVPIEESGSDFHYTDLQSLLSKTHGFYPNTKHPREGLVVRTIDQSLSFKIINNEYLIKYE